LARASALRSSTEELGRDNLLSSPPASISRVQKNPSSIRMIRGGRWYRDLDHDQGGN